MAKISRWTVGASVVSVALLAASLAAAQAPQIVRVRATIESVSGQTLSVKSRDGAVMKVELAPNAPVNQVVKASLSDIKKGDYIAVTAMPQPDGSQKASTILIFPAAMRGVGEGSRPWDFTPGSTMTNATVADEVTGVSGETVSVTYKGGQQKVAVSPATEIVEYKKASAADLKAGEKIFVAGAKKLPDGTLQAPNVSYGDYGVWR
ncbi:MAG: DUF5666 domain-containing protein [Xanthobacteraceae bacterium]|jgi:hypothetical protein